MYSKPRRRDDGVAAWVSSHPFIHEAETQKDVRCIFAGFVLNVVSKPLNWPSKISLLVLLQQRRGIPKLLSCTTLLKVQFWSEKSTFAFVRSIKGKKS